MADGVHDAGGVEGLVTQGNGIVGVAEEGRIAIRNVRRDVIGDMREMKKDGDVGEDDERRAEADLQKLTDKSTGEIDELLKGKEEEILTV